MNNVKSNDKYVKYPILLDLKSELELSGHAQNTIENYVTTVFKLLEFSQVDDPHNLTEDHFRDYLKYLHTTDLSKRSINAYNSFIRFFQAILLKPINFFRVPMCKFPKKEIEFLTPSMITDLLNTTRYDTKMDCIIKLAICCGCRINEVASLKVSDIDIDSMRIHIVESKRNKSRYVPIDHTAYLALKRYSRDHEHGIHLKLNDYLFTFNLNKSKTNNETLRRNFYIYRDRAGLSSHITFHSLRHTFAVNYINAGGDIVHLQYLMGHSSLSSTAVYLHIAYNNKMAVDSFMDSLLKEDEHE